MKAQKEINESQKDCGRVAAFFDLDGTLLPGPSLEKRFYRALRYRREVGVRNYLQWVAEAVRLLRRGSRHIVQANKMYLRGVQILDQSYGKNSQALPWHGDGHQAGGQAGALPRRNPRLPVPGFFAEAVDRVAWHAEQGHAIVLVSGTLEPLARGAAQALVVFLGLRGIAAAIGVCATRLETLDRNWTGRIVGEAMFGEAKAQAISRIRTDLGLDLTRCFAYGDGVNDVKMLEAVGKPAAVNPSIGLRRIARRKEWPVLHWGMEKDLTRNTPGAQRAEESEHRLEAILANAGNGK